QMDAVDSAVDLIALLRGAIHAPVVAFVLGEAEAAEPVGCVWQELVAAAGAADRPSVLEGGLRLGLRRDAALPAQEAEHGVAIVERHPGARMDVAGEFACRDLDPEWEQEIGEAPVNTVFVCRAVGGVLRAPGGIGDLE